MVTYIPDEHLYLDSNGVLIPGVSTLLGFKFKEQYKNIPEEILKNKAQYGTEVHAAIESYIKGEKQEINTQINSALKEYIRITEEALLKPKEIEKMVDYKERYAGRFDAITVDNIVVDYKTTYSTSEEKWGWQLGYYALAIKEYNKKVNTEFGYVVWLPKNKKGRLIRVDYPNKKELLDNLKNYEESNVLPNLQ